MKREIGTCPKCEKTQIRTQLTEKSVTVRAFGSCAAAQSDPGGGVFDDTDTGNAPSKRMNSVCPPQVGNKSERVPRERRRSAHGVRTRDAATRLAGSGASRRPFVTHSAVAARVFRLFCRFFFSGVGGTAVVRTVEYRFSVGGARTVTRPRLIADR